MNSIDIIGIGQGRSDLTPHHLELIGKCDVLVGGKRQLGLFDTTSKQTLVIKGKLSPVIHAIKEEAKTNKIVVLASGDPLFYGIGATLTRYFDRKHLKIHPNISSISAAFAAIKEPWHDARLVSLHGKETNTNYFDEIDKDEKIAFLTDPEKDPHYIAKKLIQGKILNYRLCVLENLGHSEHQKIRWFDHPDELDNISFAQPNIVILKKKLQDQSYVSRETHLGMDDDCFSHSKGLITKSEVRAVTLAKLKLTHKDHVLWDIGAGSGSVSIEAALQLSHGKVFAFEQHSDRISNILENCKQFNCSNISIINTAFPSGIETLDRPDRIFIGGGGKNINSITQAAFNRLDSGGIIVINTVLIQSLEAAINALEKNKCSPQVIQMQVSRSKQMPFGQRMEALNPVWIISGSKPKNENHV